MSELSSALPTLLHVCSSWLHLVPLYRAFIKHKRTLFFCAFNLVSEEQEKGTHSKYSSLVCPGSLWPNPNIMSRQIFIWMRCGNLKVPIHKELPKETQGRLANREMERCDLYGTGLHKTLKTIENYCLKHKWKSITRKKMYLFIQNKHILYSGQLQSNNTFSVFVVQWG